MTILLTCGLQRTWCEFVQDRLSSMGIQDPIEAAKTAFTPHMLTKKMCAAHKLSLTSSSDIDQAAPGKAWQIAAADIFMANAENGTWGWSDPRNIYFLEFWRDFDPLCKFVLVYGSPAQSLACSLATEDFQADDIQEHLSQWVSYHEQLLRFYQANRDHSLLIKIDKFEDTAADVTELLAKQLDLEPRLLNDSAMREISPILALIADKLLAANDLEQALYTELESSADLPGNELEDNTAIMPQHAYKEFLAARVTADSDQQKSSEIENLQTQINQLTQNLSDAETAASDNNLTDDLTNQNELLMLQLHQVQEELELYFGKYQDLKTKSDTAKEPASEVKKATNIAASSTPIGTPSDTVVDMRSYVNGTGWHSPEQAGRWAGPDRISTLKLPALGQDRHQIEIKIVDAMSLDIAKNVSLSLDGKPLTATTQILSELTGTLAPLRRIRANLQKADKPFPMKVVATLPTDADRDSEGEHTLTITCPETVSPSQFGQPDTRALSVCIECIKLIRVT